jgi:formyltetrahydrofolate-dependent phosphoribosylglycinamide formyltransferase
VNASRRIRVAVLISGRGTNMTALVNAAIDPRFPAEIALVLSNRASAPGLAMAAERGISTRVVPHANYPDRESHEAAIHAELVAAGIEIVCLAGYMRLLTPDFVTRWQGRMINIHPSLLPSFKGLDTHARALAAGCRVHGATVHFVGVEMDEGPIIAQAAVPVLAGDDAESLAARVLGVEHRLYPLALKMVSEGSARMSGSAVVIVGEGATDPAQVLVSAG